MQFLENNILVPRVMDKSVGVNPILALLALTVLGSLLGVIGALLAIPMVAILQVIVDQYILNTDTSLSQQPLDKRDYLSTIRYRAQDLIGDLRKQLRANSGFDEPEQDQFADEVEAIASDLDSILAQQEPSDIEL